jgi:hypothetical protein
MRKALHGGVLVTTMLWAPFHVVGCSAIGSALEGAIDGDREYTCTPDSVLSDKKGADNSGADRVVKVVTPSGSLVGGALKADTVLALRREPDSSGQKLTILQATNGAHVHVHTAAILRGFWRGSSV